MYLVLDYKDVVTEIATRAIYIKRLKNGYVDFATENDADSVYVEDTDSYYPAKLYPGSCNVYHIVELNEVPEDVKPLRYRYTGEGFEPLESLTSSGMSPEQRLAKLESIVYSLLGNPEEANLLTAETQSLSIRKVVQMYAQSSVTEDARAMEIADIYPTWEELVEAKAMVPAKTIFKYGVDSFGDIQLWRFVSDYVPTSLYTPDQDPTHYTKIGVTEEGVPEWVQPLGATDAYMLGDEVSHKGEIWISDYDNNVWEPGVYGWTKKATEETQEGDGTE